jgi:peptide methionine sulfoxide reductase MsrB
MVILLLLFLNFNKRLRHKKAEVKNKDNFKHTRRNVNYVDCDSDSSSDESNDVYDAEFYWPSKAKSYAYDSLKPIHKNW